MTDRSHYAPVEAQIREQMGLVVAILRPYSQSAGSFNDWDDLREALRSAAHALERAQTLANYRLPPHA